MTASDGQDEDLDRPNAARIYDYLLGGAQNVRADRAAAAHVLDNYPDAALAARANRAFLRRTVAFLAGQGITQFLDVGSGLPTVGNVHEVARGINPTARVVYVPKARVVYVDNDPVAVRYSRELLVEEGEGARGVAVIEADLRAPAAILSHPDTRRLLDLRRPLGLLLVAVLHFIPDDDEARRAVRAVREALAPGSYVVISHATLDGLPADVIARFEAIYRRSTTPTIARPRADRGAVRGLGHGGARPCPDAPLAPGRRARPARGGAHPRGRPRRRRAHALGAVRAATVFAP